MSSQRFMLDTNIVSDMVRNPEGRSFARWSETGYADLCVSAIVVSELRFGVEKKQAPKLARGVDNFLRRVEILPYEPPADVHYAIIRASLERQGLPIGPVDLFIAAHARSLDLTLVTDNIREFSRVEGLRLENWIEGEPANV